MGYHIRKSTPRRQVSCDSHEDCAVGEGVINGVDNVAAQQGHAFGYKSDGMKQTLLIHDNNNAMSTDGGLEKGIENGAVGSGQHVKRHGERDSNEGQGRKKEFKVMQTLYKRLRNAKKRLRGIDEIRDKAAAGKTLNADQVAALESRDAVVAVVEELEKLQVLLKEAVEDDVEWGRCEGIESNQCEMEKRKVEWEKETKTAVKKAVNRAKNDAKQMARKEAKAAGQEAMKSTVDAMVDLLYFAGVFDPFVPFQAEKGAALHYAAVSECQSVAGDSLDLIGLLGKMCTARALGTAMSHKEALEKCKEIALQYVTGSKDVLGDANVRSEEVKNIIQEVKGLEYFLAPAHVVAATMNGLVGPASVSATAAAAGTHVPPHPHAMSIQGPMHVAAPISGEHALAQHMPVMDEHEYMHTGVNSYGQADAPMVYLHNAVYPTPESAAASGQNLVSQFFGQRSHGKAACHGPEKGSKNLGNQGPGSFKGDEGLGIQEMNGVEHTSDPLESGDANSNSKVKQPDGMGKNRPSETKKGHNRHNRNAKHANASSVKQEESMKVNGERNNKKQYFAKKRTNGTTLKQDEIKARH